MRISSSNFDIADNRLSHCYFVFIKVRRGLDTLLFNLLVLGSLCNKMGRMWRRRNSDLYVIEITTNAHLPTGFSREEEIQNQEVSQFRVVRIVLWSLFSLCMRKVDIRIICTSLHRYEQCHSYRHDKVDPRQESTGQEVTVLDGSVVCVQFVSFSNYFLSLSIFHIEVWPW